MIQGQSSPTDVLDPAAWVRAAALHAGEFHNLEVRRALAQRAQHGRAAAELARDGLERLVAIDLIRPDERAQLERMIDVVNASPRQAPTAVVFSLQEIHDALAADPNASPVAIASAGVALSSAQQVATWVCATRSNQPVPGGVPDEWQNGGGGGGGGGDGNGGGGGGGGKSAGEVIVWDLVAFVWGAAVAGTWGFVIAGGLGAAVFGLAGGASMAVAVSVDEAT